MLSFYFINIAKTIINKVVVGIKRKINLDSIKEREKGNKKLHYKFIVCFIWFND
jgi:hypothetical protein